MVCSPRKGTSQPQAPGALRPSLQTPLPLAPRPRPRASFGFTLIEVLVALAILAVSCTAVIKAVVSVQDTFLKEQQRQTAVMLGSEKMARIELQGPGSVSLWQGRFEGSPEFGWTLDVREVGEDGLLTKAVLKVHHGQEDNVLAELERLFFTPPE